jgi:Protein of unknown function (DUF1580)
MIDFTKEHLLSMSLAAREWPGGEVHVSTLHRLRLRGTRNVVLECVRVGGPWCTSREAIARFIGRLNAEDADTPSDGGAIVTSAASSLAAKELDRAGI